MEAAHAVSADLRRCGTYGDIVAKTMVRITMVAFCSMCDGLLPVVDNR